MATVAELRSLLEKHFPGALPAPQRTSPVLPVGFAPFGSLLPNGGFARGTLSVWDDGVGASALLWRVAQDTVVRGERAAWIEGGGVRSVAREGGCIHVHPPSPDAAWEAAEVLTSSGGVAFLVLMSSVTAPRNVRSRLVHAAREGGAVLVERSEEPFMASLRLTSSASPDGYRWTRGPWGDPALATSVRVRVGVRGMHWSREGEVDLPIASADGPLRLAPAEAPDRRGAA